MLHPVSMFVCGSQEVHTIGMMIYIGAQFLCFQLFCTSQFWGVQERTINLLVFWGVLIQDYIVVLVYVQRHVVVFQCVCVCLHVCIIIYWSTR